MQSYKFIFLLFIITACTSKAKKERQARADFPESYLTQDTAAPFDSANLNQFISAERKAERYQDEILDFYRRRDFRYAWFNGDTLTASVYTFYNQLRWFWETGNDSLAFNPELDNLLKNTGNAPGNFPSLKEKLRMEFLLTTQFFDFARYQYEGRIQQDLRALDWYIPRGKKNYQMLLDSLVAGVTNLAATEPVNRQYKMLKKYLVHYNEILQKDTVSLRSSNIRTAQNDSTFIYQLRRKLILRKDLAPADSGYHMDQKLTEGIRSYQQRMGLQGDGKINAELLTHLNESPVKQIRKILVNMERLRWVPSDPAGEYILVNIPEYRLHVSRDSNLLFSMNVVVGTEATQTTVFSGMLSTIVFSPYWNVPQSIIINEMLPILQRNPGYLNSKNMEVLKDGKVIDPYSVKWNEITEPVPYQIRQKPGPDNSLGHIKFLFPNQYSIYLHDTPSRNLFQTTDRSYSHGCIRLAEPVKLAEFLLRDDPSWTSESIEEAMYSGEEKFVKLKSKVPVFIGYFTAWVDRSGKLNLRDDIYDHDAKLSAELFGN